MFFVLHTNVFVCQLNKLFLSYVALLNKMIMLQIILYYFRVEAWHFPLIQNFGVRIGDRHMCRKFLLISLRVELTCLNAFGTGEQGPSPVQTECFASKRANFQITTAQTKMEIRLLTEFFLLPPKSCWLIKWLHLLQSHIIEILINWQNW